METTLVALAAFAATAAFAQSTQVGVVMPSGAMPTPAQYSNSGVSITGVFDAGYGSLTYKGGNRENTIAYNGTATSQLDFLGVEDLGGGMKADFFFESDINPTTQYNTGAPSLNGVYTVGATGAANAAPTNTTSAQAASTWGNGQVKLGLRSSIGYIAVGAVNNAGLDANQMTQPFGTAYGSGFGTNWTTVGKGYGTASKVRYDNSLLAFPQTSRHIS